MNEQELGRNIAQHLNRGARELDPGVLARLQAGRNQALSHYRAEARQYAHAHAGREGSWFGAHIPQGSRVWVGVGVVALVVGMVGMGFWQQQQNQQPELGSLDAALLSGELPIHAYTQQDFKTWLRDNSR